MKLTKKEKKRFLKYLRWAQETRIENIETWQDMKCDIKDSYIARAILQSWVNDAHCLKGVIRLLENN